MAAAEEEVHDDAALEAAREAALAEREKRVDSLLRTAKGADALKAALADPPFASKNPALKDRSAACVLKAVVAVGAKDTDLNAFLEALDADSADVLMKYVYKGLQRAENSGLLLKIHAQLVEKCGLGTIVRAICDRKTA